MSLTADHGEQRPVLSRVCRKVFDPAGIIGAIVAATIGGLIVSGADKVLEHKVTCDVRVGYEYVEYVYAECKIV
jgi:hypothetical protein